MVGEKKYVLNIFLLGVSMFSVFYVQRQIAVNQKSYICIQIKNLKIWCFIFKFLQQYTVLLIIFQIYKKYVVKIQKYRPRKFK